jgi:hypothetical protein
MACSGEGLRVVLRWMLWCRAVEWAGAGTTLALVPADTSCGGGALANRKRRRSGEDVEVQQLDRRRVVGARRQARLPVPLVSCGAAVAGLHMHAGEA